MNCSDDHAAQSNRLTHDLNAVLAAPDQLFREGHRIRSARNALDLNLAAITGIAEDAPWSSRSARTNHPGVKHHLQWGGDAASRSEMPRSKFSVMRGNSYISDDRLRGPGVKGGAGGARCQVCFRHPSCPEPVI
jgi:hypothetical protein